MAASGRRSRGESSQAQTDDPWKYAKVVATAPGYGPVWERTPMPPNPESRRADDLTLRLAPDDVPIEGRILTAEGRPIAGERIRAFTVTYSQNANGMHIPWDSMGRPRAVSDAPGEPGGQGDDRCRRPLPHDGTRPRSTGVAMDERSSVAQQEIQVQTRRVPTKQVEVPVDGRPAMRPLYGVSFVHIAEPARSIHGIVRERGTGKPIAGALANTLATDEQGRFQIDGLPPRFNYRLDVDLPAGTPYFRRRLFVESQGPGL